MARTKFVFIYFSGAQCPMVRRMRYTERRPAAVEALGSGGMIDWDREHVADVTLDELLKHLLASVVADDGGADMSVGALREAALEQIQKASEQVKRIPPKGKGRRGRRGSLIEQMGRSLKSVFGAGGSGPRTALALRNDFKTESAVEMVSAQKGALNWLLVTPELALLEAGGGSLPEMYHFLPDADVAYALVRMGFGSGRFRRNHFLFVHWAGANCPAVKRGKANHQKDAVKRALRTGHPLEYFAQSLDDIALPDVIAKMSRYLVIDGETKGQETVDPTSGITVEAFEEALKEDNQALADEFGIEALPTDEAEEAAADDEEAAMPVTEAVRSVRSVDEPFNWVLIGPRK